MARSPVTRQSRQKESIMLDRLVGLIQHRFWRTFEPSLSGSGVADVGTRPFKIKFPLKKGPPDLTILESGCFEGESDQVHLKEGMAVIPEGHYKQ